MFAKLRNWYLVIILGIIGAMYFNIDRRMDYFEERLDLANGTISLQCSIDSYIWSEIVPLAKSKRSSK